VCGDVGLHFGVQEIQTAHDLKNADHKLSHLKSGGFSFLEIRVLI